MVTKPWIFFGCLLLGCTQEYDGVEPALELDGYVQEGNYIYNRNAFRGNDVAGSPFFAVCPRDQAIVGLSIGTNGEGKPNGVSLRCAQIDVAGNLGPPAYGEWFGAKAEPGTETKLECYEGEDDASSASQHDATGGAANDASEDDRQAQVAVTLTGHEDVPFSLSPNVPPPPPAISRLGIECVDAKAWMMGSANQFDQIDAGGVPWGTIPFADSCMAGVFVLNGFYGRFSEKLEQVSPACMTQNQDAQLYLKILVGQGKSTP